MLDTQSTFLFSDILSMNARLAQFLFFQEELYKVVAVNNSTEIASISVVFEPKYDTLVICDSPTSEDAELLEKILVAVKLSSSSIDLMACSTNSMAGFEKIFKNSVTKKIINFGVNLPQIEQYFLPQLYVIQQEGELIYLYSENLSKINQSPEAKKKLWANLKSMF